MAFALGLGVPFSLVSFGAGLATAFVPGIPRIHLDPMVLLSLLLPPTLYIATVNTTVHLLRHTLTSGVLLGLVLVPATIGGVALAAHAAMPELSWTTAVLLGVVASVSETRLLKETGRVQHLPRAITDTLRGQEVVAPVMILSIFLLATDAASAGAPSAGDVALRFGRDLLGGVPLGLAIGAVVTWLRRRAAFASVEISASIATPFVASLAADAMGLSVVVPILVAGVFVSAFTIDRRTGGVPSSSQARLIARVFWDEAGLILSGILFFLAGHSLPEAMAGLEQWPFRRLAMVAALLLLVVLAVQFAVSLAATFLPPGTAALRRTGQARARLAAAGLMTWSPTRSVIGLIIAMSIPQTLAGGEAFPDRTLMLVLASLIVVGSILVQGLALPLVVRPAAFGDAAAEQAEEDRAARSAMEAARARRPDAPLNAERLALLDLRARNRIGDAVLYKLLEDVDLRAVADAGKLTDPAAS